MMTFPQEFGQHGLRRINLRNFILLSLLSLNSICCALSLLELDGPQVLLRSIARPLVMGSQSLRSRGIDAKHGRVQLASSENNLIVLRKRTNGEDVSQTSKQAEAATKAEGELNVQVYNIIRGEKPKRALVPQQPKDSRDKTGRGPTNRGQQQEQQKQQNNQDKRKEQKQQNKQVKRKQEKQDKQAQGKEKGKKRIPKRRQTWRQRSEMNKMISKVIKGEMKDGRRQEQRQIPRQIQKGIERMKQRYEGRKKTLRENREKKSISEENLQTLHPSSSSHPVSSGKSDVNQIVPGKPSKSLKDGSSKSLENLSSFSSGSGVVKERSFEQDRVRDFRRNIMMGSPFFPRSNHDDEPKEKGEHYLKEAMSTIEQSSFRKRKNQEHGSGRQSLTPLDRKQSKSGSVDSGKQGWDPDLSPLSIKLPSSSSSSSLGSPPSPKRQGKKDGNQIDPNWHRPNDAFHFGGDSPKSDMSDHTNEQWNSFPAQSYPYNVFHSGGTENSSNRFKTYSNPFPFGGSEIGENSEHVLANPRAGEWKRFGFPPRQPSSRQNSGSQETIHDQKSQNQEVPKITQQEQGARTSLQEQARKWSEKWSQKDGQQRTQRLESGSKEVSKPSREASIENTISPSEGRTESKPYKKTNSSLPSEEVQSTQQTMIQSDQQSKTEPNSQDEEEVKPMQSPQGQQSRTGILSTLEKIREGTYSRLAKSRRRRKE